jgi:hypothetical protein
MFADVRGIGAVGQKRLPVFFQQFSFAQSTGNFEVFLRFDVHQDK